MGKLEDKGEDWSPALICQGRDDDVANTLYTWLPRRIAEGTVHP